ncbi:MAG: toll/interleukin-1 receptor domain-containing protein [Prevotellaceae bacterium]|jgi:hypothetical protein|nr:toll/interleukin-1 receptor domain-containing protein [Prevotellaceae bacterium]
MESQYEYYAFISYKREDEKWAKWLQNRLENYRLPAVIRNELPRLPKRIRPVFRDKTDLGAGLLTDSLRTELSKSQYLIVICSPLSAQSKWVGKEIAAFADMGRADRIIPFVVQGEPNSQNPQQECFHAVMKEKAPDVLGVNVNEIGKQQAFVKVVAKLLDLRFDALWNRFLREQRKNNIIAAVLGLFCLAGIFYVWDYNRTKTEYYADYVDRWGIPEGVIQLTKAQVAKRHAHYRFERSRRKLRRVVYANSAGWAVEHSYTEHINRPAIQELLYTDKRLSITELKNSKGKTVATYFWGGKNYDRIDIKKNKEAESAMALATSFTSVSRNLISEISQNVNRPSIKRFKLERNENGYVIRKEFKQHNGDDRYSVCDAYGIYGLEYELDSVGRINNIFYLGFDGIRCPNNIGIIERRYEYDIYGNICKVEYYNDSMQLILNPNYWAVNLSISNEDGNVIESYFYDSNNRLFSGKRGYASRKAKYDDCGNKIEQAFFENDGTPAVGDGCAKWTAKYDKYGNEIEASCFGIDGKLSLYKGEYAKLLSKYDDQGNKIEESYFDINDMPCLHKGGFAKWIATYNERGNRIEQSYYGLDNTPCVCKDGFSKWIAKYDEQGNMIDVSCFGTNGKPCLVYYGFSSWTAKYNEQGNKTETSYFGIDGKPCIGQDGFAKFTITYDERGNEIESSYFDISDMPCLRKEGLAKWIAKYDEQNNRVETSFWGTDGKPCLINNNDYAKWTAKYDEHRNQIEQIYYGIDGQPCLTKYGNAKWTAKYDNRGNKIETSYFGIDGKPSICKKGYAKWTAKYDERGNTIEVLFFDAKEKIIDKNF